ncbi:MAG: hypothetical protein A2Y71_01830 [Bacteroidetes bacterium RBG_13_42_15]|nr:MAG: hypothetical protein A2Y71_01830 [Bacteroidetes bacterium RBG_13_42_15]
MENKSNINTYQYPSTLDELVVDMENHPDRYKHLQFILNRQKHINLGHGQLYLVVNHAGFDLYELNSVDYSNGIIKMILTNPDTGNPSEINLAVYNEHPDIYLINWKDVLEMAYSERIFGNADNDVLLELEDE